MKRKGTKNLSSNVRIPADVKARAVGLKLELPFAGGVRRITITNKTDAIRVSYGTADPAQVKTRHAGLVAYLESIWQALRRDAVVLTRKDAWALAGKLYVQHTTEEWDSVVAREWFRPTKDGKLQTDKTTSAPAGPTFEDFDPESLAGAIARLGDPELDLETQLGPLANKLLLKVGILGVDPLGRMHLLAALRDLIIKGITLQQRRLGGDFSTDPALATLAEWKDPASPKGSGVSLTNLVELWWKEAEKSGRTLSTYESYRGTFKRLSDFLKHDDALSVTADNVIAYKDHRLAVGVSPKTVGDSDLAGIKAVFAWAVSNRKVPSNPAEGVRVVKEKRVKLRERGFTEDEAVAILAHARAVVGTSKLAEAKRWVPWLNAYTGARVGEMVQLRPKDLTQDGEMWVLKITPEAGTVKDKEARDVVLHSHLVDLGFPDYVARCKGQNLFLKDTNDVRKAVKTVKTRLGEFTREVVKDTGVAPNHGWRHTFKTRGRDVGISDRVLDGICGHEPGTEGGKYGSVTLKAQGEAMKVFPRFALPV